MEEAGTSRRSVWLEQGSQGTAILFGEVHEAWPCSRHWRKAVLIQLFLMGMPIMFQYRKHWGHSKSVPALEDYRLLSELKHKRVVTNWKRRYEVKDTIKGVNSSFSRSKQRLLFLQEIFNLSRHKVDKCHRCRCPNIQVPSGGVPFSAGAWSPK